MNNFMSMTHESILDKFPHNNQIVIYKDEKYYIDKLYKSYGEFDGMIRIRSIKDDRITIRIMKDFVIPTKSIILIPQLIEPINIDFLELGGAWLHNYSFSSSDDLY